MLTQITILHYTITVFEHYDMIFDDNDLRTQYGSMY